MAKKVLFAVFVAIISANVQAVLVRALLDQQALPNFVNVIAKPLPAYGQLSHNIASSASATASSHVDDFRTYFVDLRNGLRDVDFSPRFTLLRRFVDGDTLPNFATYPTAGVNGHNGYAASSAAAASAIRGASNGGLLSRLYRRVPEWTGDAGSEHSASSTGSLEPLVLP